MVACNINCNLNGRAMLAPTEKQHLSGAINKNLWRRTAMEFNEIKMWNDIKNKPGMFFGKRSIILLNSFLNGIKYSFEKNSCLLYFQGFNEWYMKKRNVDTNNAYTIWWNHILFTSGNNDDLAFDAFISYFEEYLQEQFGLSLQ